MRGRSEGFAVTSLMFHAGVLDPNDFGGETVADLRLFGNHKLQEEIAYWAATQSVPSAVTSDVRHQAKDVLPFLAEALVLLEETEETIDLLLSDIVMPQMGGMELASELNERWPHIKILLMSGYPSRDVLDKSALEIDTPFLGKPFSFQELCDKVAEVLAGSLG
jgi:CheY-like chemotaxis protein